MDLFTNNDLKRLSVVDSAWCVSIYLPTHRASSDTQQDPIRLKNLLRQAESQLLAAGLRKPDIASILEPPAALQADRDFWQHQSDGLAIFAGAGRLDRYRLPLRLTELVIVAQRFQLKPLLPLFAGDGHFYILALSQNEVRLLEATRHAVDEIDAGGLPASFDDAIGLKKQEKHLQFHTRSGERGGQRAAMFHGQGPGKEVTKQLLTKYFRQIDEAVCEILKDDPAPLVLAGVEYYFPMYRAVSRYRQLLANGVAGNPETLRPDELHSGAWPLVEPTFRQARETAMARYRQLAGTGRTSDNVLEVLPAAHEGRVETVFVATDRQQWGTFDSDSLQVVLKERSDPHNEDLTDRAAIETYLKGGTVFALPSGDLPSEEPLAVIYRF